MQTTFVSWGQHLRLVAWLQVCSCSKLSGYLVSRRCHVIKQRILQLCSMLQDEPGTK